MQTKHRGRPLVGVTADIEWRCDTQPPRLHYELDEHLCRALHAAGASVVILAHDDHDAGSWCDRLDGVVVSGGAWAFPVVQLIDAGVVEPPHKVRRARFEMALVSAALERDLPFLGICGGFQILNRVAGGELVVDLAALDSALAVHAGPDRARTVHRVNPMPGSRLAALVGGVPFYVNSQHRQGVLVSPAIVAARSDDGLVEAIEVPGQRFCAGVQWHPEFSLSMQDEALLKGFVEACGRLADPISLMTGAIF